MSPRLRHMLQRLVAALERRRYELLGPGGRRRRARAVRGRLHRLVRRARPAPAATVHEHRPLENRPPRPRPPVGARSLVVVVLDSLRHDATLEADTPTLDALGTVERRWSYASWTAPSHYNLLTGLLPHASPSRVYASDLYRDEYRRHGERLGIPSMGFEAMLPALWWPEYLHDVVGYRTRALVSMPVLNPATGVNRGFDSYALMPSHFDLPGIIDQVSVERHEPAFWMLNVGETHYPYTHAGDDPSRWPRISGVHGVVKRLADGEDEGVDWFTPAELAELRARQIASLEYCDRQLAALFDRLPDDTWVVVTSDHGELFGEDDYFGHGPINHPKVLEVPFVEGVVP